MSTSSHLKSRRLTCRPADHGDHMTHGWQVGRAPPNKLIARQLLDSGDTAVCVPHTRVLTASRLPPAQMVDVHAKGSSTYQIGGALSTYLVILCCGPRRPDLVPSPVSEARSG